MADVVSKKKRSEMMSGIRGKDTKPELLIRSALHRNGYRFRLHRKDLPGKPDIVLAKYNAVILVHGCFWHGHDCHLFKWPKSRTEFWREKITRNKSNDEKAMNALMESGWRVLEVWECAIKGRTKLSMNDVLHQMKQWLDSGDKHYVIRGKDH